MPGHYVYMTPKVYEDVFGEEPDYEDIVFLVMDEYKDQTEEIGQKIMESPAVTEYQLYSQHNGDGKPYAQHSGNRCCSPDRISWNAGVCRAV